MNGNVFQTAPVVFAVQNTYQIMVPVTYETLMWVKVGQHKFYDHANGTLRSATSIHRIVVPQQLLDAEGQYSVCYRIVKERKPYFTETEDEQEEIFPFFPVPKGGSRAFLIADAHNNITELVSAAKQFEARYGQIDFVILNGDIPNDCGKIENLNTIYELAGQITLGRRPVVYAKGNHDMRGVFAEKMEEYCPSFHGQSYFTWQVGDIWGVSLDCGEDKVDSHAEYGHTVCCHQFRLEETEFLRDVIEEKAYCNSDVRHRVVLSHNPFSMKYEAPFNIEEELYRHWCTILKENIVPDIMICGHLHALKVYDPGCEADYLGQPCRVVVGAATYYDEDEKYHYIGTGFFFTDNGISFVFINDQGKEYSYLK